MQLVSSLDQEERNYPSGGRIPPLTTECISSIPACDNAVLMILCLNTVTLNLQGVPIKNNPLAKFIISVTVTDFFTKFTGFTGGFRLNMQISLQYLLRFRNYNHLNLKVQFSQ